MKRIKQFLQELFTVHVNSQEYCGVICYKNQCRYNCKIIPYCNCKQILINVKGECETSKSDKFPVDVEINNTRGIK